ncbi:MAG: ChaN family lipoprotein [Pseudomonadota bacterium]
MAVSPRKELLEIQKQLFRRNKRIIDSSILYKEPGFDSYERAYRKSVSDYSSLTTIDKMVKAVLKSDIIYVGDYHTCNQSQRSFLRIIKETVKVTECFSVGLELIHAKHQATLDKFMSSKISEKTFLNRIQLQEHWVYDLWDNFKPLFDFCRYHRIKIYAIDAAPPGSTVRERDKAFAKIIADVWKANPDKKMFVFIGDLHISPQHLPRDVRSRIHNGSSKGDFRDLILYQSSEKIYWKLAEKGLFEKTEVVKLDDKSYCRMHTPPIVFQRSYLNWLEHDEGEIDFADVRHEFVEIVDRICKFMRIDVDEVHLDKLEIFTSGDLGFLKRMKDLGFTPRDIEQVKKQILSSESYYIAKANIVYLANLSINHAAEEASHFVKSICSGPEKPRQIDDAFYANILHEAIGFFGSKIINSKRKSFHLRDFKSLINYLEGVGIPPFRRLEYDTALFVCDYKRYEQRGKFIVGLDFLLGRMDLFIAVTHSLGYILGERLFYGLLANHISKKRIKELFYERWNKENEAKKVYVELIKRLKKTKVPKRM